MTKKLEVAKKYGFDYEKRFKDWIKDMKSDRQVFFGLKDLVRELMRRGIVERVPAPKPFGTVVFRIKGEG